jgi:hypothetical protein
MLRAHHKFPDEVDRQDPDFIEEYQALITAERRIAAEEDARQKAKAELEKADPLLRGRAAREKGKRAKRDILASDW